MSSTCAQSTEDGEELPSFQAEDLSDSSDEQSENEEEDEDEDVDFNPFIKEALSPEASSSLSSENEGLDINVAPKETESALDCGDLENVEDEEVVMQIKKESEYDERSKKRKAPPEAETGGKENASSSVVEDVGKDLGDSDKCIIDVDDQDAICRRTRARYSLANFTLDELENFLQETDDEDDIQNVDDEQEYRKFLAAVLQGGENEAPVQENENVDDEDEDSDVDFEMEIEEALDSDRDENMTWIERKEKYGRASRRPETRQNRQQKASFQDKKFVGQTNRSVRPLVPLVPYPPIASSPSLDYQKLFPASSYHYAPYAPHSGVANAFTPHQISQLHCLIHEHAQLLVQVFSLCVLDHSRQDIAGTVKRLMTELVNKRNEALSSRKVPYPDFFFRPPYIQSSVTNKLPTCALGSEKDGQDTALIHRNTCSSEGKAKECGQNDCHQNASGSSWVPSVSGPVLSILDAAPLSLVMSYIGDVSKAVREYQQRHLESSSGSPFEREPLFPLSTISSVAECSSEYSMGSASHGSTTSPTSLPSPQQPKKSLAAVLVENTKKESVAFAPKKIVKLAQKFYPLFNSELFPHKPPPAALTNRVLFTDAEDELLALGMMEYNTDWKAIQQRFLPCKSKHQIFVRQKNRCSSKAPENPIKAVRRMKTSPLTEEEKARIHEGLKVLKLDWMSVWKFIVPYRDPSLLPRQWRIALGTQKSYKTDEAKKEKRRIYESQKRKSRAATLSSWQMMSEKEDCLGNNAADGNKSGDDNLDDEDDTYVHEAFLSDWRPGNSQPPCSKNPLSSISRRDSNTVLPSKDNGLGQPPAGRGYVEPQPYGNGYQHEFRSSKFSQYLQSASHFAHVRYNASYNTTSNHIDPDWMAKSSKNQVRLPPRGRRKKDLQLVKLAPELPPVNLPPSVRVISQSAFKSYHCVKSHSTETSGSHAETENHVPRVDPVLTSGKLSGGHSYEKNNRDTSSQPQDSRLHLDQVVSEDKGAESDLQMHPLLFHAPEKGDLHYCSVDSRPSASGTINFLQGNQLQANFSQFSKPHDAGSTVDHFYTSLSPIEKPSSSHTIDFHPLLQRADDLHNDSVIVSDRHMPVDVESFGGHFSRLRNSSSPNKTWSHNSCRPTYAPDLNKPYEKATELDLEIHLSSTSREENIMAGNEVTENNYDGSRIGLLKSGIKENRKDPMQVSDKDYLQFSFAVNASKPGHNLGDCLLVPRNNISGYSEDIIGEQPHREIVMEQEELSDSEEEEPVDFECEEMADSEGEGPHSDHLVNRPGVLNVRRGGQVMTNCDPKEGLCAAKGSIHSRKLGLMAGDIDLSETALQLSLDSFATQSKSTKVGRRNDQAGQSLSSRPNRSCKRTMPNSMAGTTQMNPIDMLQQLQLGNAEGTTMKPTRRPRKRVDRNCSTVTACRNSGCISNSNLVNFCPSDACGVNDVPKNAADVEPLASEGSKWQGSIELNF